MEVSDFLKKVINYLIVIRRNIQKAYFLIKNKMVKTLAKVEGLRKKILRGINQNI